MADKPGPLTGKKMRPTGIESGRRTPWASAWQARLAGVDNVEFLSGMIEALPLPDASVDVVILNCAIVRALKP